MATTTNYGWDTPDDTDLVKDGASAIRTLGSSIDTTTKALNPSTTLGDIEYRSATANTNTRLPIGTSGQYLSVNGSGVPAWSTLPAGGTSSFSLLNTGGTALTGATTITVSGLSGYEKYMVFVEAASSVNASAFINLRINGDTGGKYDWFGVGIYGASTVTSSEIDAQNGLGINSFSLGRMSNQATSNVLASCFITGGKTTGGKSAQMTGAGKSDGGNGNYAYMTQGIYNGTAVISSISIVSSSGNFDNGTVYIYGSA